MPKKHQVTAASVKSVEADLDRTRMSLFNAIQVLNRFYRRDDQLVRKARYFYDSFAKFKMECEIQLKADLKKNVRTR